MTALIWTGLLSLLLQGPQLPTPTTESVDERYLEQREFTSPVSGETFLAWVLREDPRVTDWDYDGCPHPPVNTLAYALVIDPRTGYVAVPERFEQPTDWDADDLAQILGEPRFKRLAPEGLPWAGAYGWEKLENAALLAQAEEQPDLVIGNLWLLAGWSVRLDVISGHNEFDQRVRELFAGLPRRGPDAGDLLAPFQLQLAEQWEELRATGQLVDVSQSSFCLALAWLYRSRGELLAAETWLREAALNNPQLPENDLLYQYLMSSIQLERYYLGSARRWLLAAWDAAAYPQTEEAGAAFLLAELNRRLGDRPAAVYWYDEASAKNMGLLNSDLISLLRAKATGEDRREEQ